MSDMKGREKSSIHLTRKAVVMCCVALRKSELGEFFMVKVNGKK